MKFPLICVFLLFAVGLLAQTSAIPFVEPAHEKAFYRADSLFKIGRFADAAAMADLLISNIEHVPHAEQDLIRPLFLKAQCALQLNLPAASDTLYYRGRTIAGRVLQTQPEIFAKLLIQAGESIDSKSHFNYGEKYFFEALRALQTLDTIGRQSYADALTATGAHYYRAQDYEKSEHFYLRAQDHWETALDTTGLAYAEFLNYMASQHRALGRYREAEADYLKCLNIRSQMRGPQHVSCAQPLTNLAQVCQLEERYKEAEQYFLRALPIRIANKAADPIRYAITINNYATLLRTMERFDEAKPLFLEAIEIRANNRNLDYYSSLSGLAFLYKMTGEYQLSDSLFRVCLAARNTLIGREAPDYLNNLRYMIDLHARMNRFDLVDEEMAQEMSTRAAILHKSARFMSERNLTEYTASLERNSASYLSYCMVRNDDIHVNTGICYNHALLHKEFVLGVGTQVRALAQASPEAQHLYDTLMTVRAGIAMEYAKPAHKRHPNLPKLEAGADKIEKVLTRHVAGLNQPAKLITWRDVQSGLDQQSAAIEFVEFPVVFPKVTDTIQYAALVLFHGKTEPVFVPLCHKKQLMDWVGAQEGPLHERTNNLYGETLYRLLWEHLEPVLQKKRIKTVYYAPAGLIHRINLEAITIPADPALVLADRYRLVMVESTRMLAKDHRKVPVQMVTSAFVYGGVIYRMDSLAIVKANQSIASRYFPGKIGASMTLRSDSAPSDTTPYLPGTWIEAVFIDSLFNAQGIHSELKLGYEATEESIKALGSQGGGPSVLHIGTHGFFTPDENDSLRIRRARANQAAASTFETSDNPLIRSGLKLAGADYAWKNEKNIKGLEDGILTAYEVSQLNLSNTQLVFLSACETGLGDINGNEGVYGLQRSFRLAGAKNLIISLWKVNDEATALLVGKYYENLILGKLPIRKAFEKAKFWLRQQPGYEAPFYWAAFVMLGENL